MASVGECSNVVSWREPVQTASALKLFAGSGCRRYFDNAFAHQRQPYLRRYNEMERLLHFSSLTIETFRLKVRSGS
ncbi:hypothetical protein GWD52_07465 [Enterobacteriaceae bacterium 4M9]|nr:hypothetical protein [Enterobacteriaceae bacterium 4M9]